MKNKIRTLFLLLLLCCVQSAMATDAVVINGLKYSLDESAKTAKVIAGNSTYTGNIVIPSSVTYNGGTYNVTAVGDKAFDQSTITSVVISEGITTLGVSSFDNCKSLKSVSLPKGLKKLGSSCFGNCYNLKSIAFPEGITKLPINCCVSNHALTKVSLPESMKILGEGCFGFCKSLKSITIPKNVVSFGKNSFLDVSLTSMTCEATTPPEATSYGAFPSVGDLYVPTSALLIYQNIAPWNNKTSRINGEDTGTSSTATNYNIDGLIYRLSGSEKTAVVCGVKDSGDIVVPSTVTLGPKTYNVVAIVDYAFYKSNVTSVVIQDGVMPLGTRCFSGCSSLTSITIPESVTSLGECCFDGCSSLTSITIPKGVTSLGDYCFWLQQPDQHHHP